MTTDPSIPFDDAVADKIAASLRLHGCSERNASALHELDVATLADWKKQQPAWARRLRQARAEFHEARLTSIREARSRDGALEWRAQAYLLEKAHLAGAEDEPSEAEGAELSPLLVITPEQLALLQKRRLAALAAMQP